MGKEVYIGLKMVHIQTGVHRGQIFTSVACFDSEEFAKQTMGEGVLPGLPIEWTEHGEGAWTTQYRFTFEDGVGVEVISISKLEVDGADTVTEKVSASDFTFEALADYLEYAFQVPKDAPPNSDAVEKKPFQVVIDVSAIKGKR